MKSLKGYSGVVVELLVIGAILLPAIAEPQPGNIIPIRPVPALPDLQVTNLTVTSPAVFHCGQQTVTCTATETNAGLVDAGRYYLHLYVGSNYNPLQPAASLQRPVLPANSSQPGGNLVFTFWNGPCDCLPSNYTMNLQLLIDGGNGVVESNEGNNWSNVVSVPGQCP